MMLVVGSCANGVSPEKKRCEMHGLLLRQRSPTKLVA